ncbi:MAG: hypothetical protein Aurels2KO_43340 [Aureliella sp.]
MLIRGIACALALVLCAPICVGKQSSDVAGGADWVDDKPRTPIPEFAYKQSPILEWLLIGPFPDGKQPENPRVLLDNLLDGEDSYWVDEHRYQWTPYSADPSGEVWLTTFCRPSGIKAQNAIVYAVCKLKPKVKEQRQYFFGADDAGTVWLGEETSIFQPGPSWYDWRNKTATAELDPAKENYCFVELRNNTGRFTFSVHSGRTLQGHATAWDGRSPRDACVVQALATENGQQVCKTFTRDNGVFTLEPIPYDVDVEYSVVGAASQTSIDALGHAQVKVGNRKTPIARAVGRREQGAKQITAIDVSKQGHIYFAAGLDGEIHRSAGNRTERYIPFDVQQISRLECRAGGDLDLLQADGGFLCWSKSPWQLGGEKVEGFNFVGDSGAKVDCFYRDVDETIWMGITASRESSVVHELLHVTPDGSVLSRHVQRMGVTGITANQDNVYVAFDLGIVDVVARDGIPAYVLPNAHVSQVVDIQFETVKDGADRLWVISTDVACYLNEDNIWTRLPAPVDSHSTSTQMVLNGQIGRIALWYDTLFQMHGDEWLRIEIDESVQCITVTPFGTVLAGTTSGRILEIKAPESRVFTVEDGLKQTWMVQSQYVDGDVLVSTYDDSPRWVRADGSVDVLDFLGTDMHLYLGGGDYLRTPLLYSNYQSVRQYSPDDVEIFRADGTSRSLGKPGDKDVLYYCCLCQLSDGAVLLGTNHGIYEVTPDRKLQLKLDAAGVPILEGKEAERLYEAPDGRLWFNYNDEGLGWWDPRTGESKLARNATPSQRATSFAKSANTPMYVGTRNGLYTVDEESLQLTRVAKDTIRTAEVDEVLIDPAGKVWVSTAHDGIYSMSNGGWVRLVGIPEVEETGSELVDIALGSSGELWICMDDCVIQYTYTSDRPSLFVDSTSSPNQTLPPTELGIVRENLQVEEGSRLALELSSWDNSRIAAFRFRKMPNTPWTMVPVGLDIEITAVGNAPRTYQIQAIDRDHNYSLVKSFTVETFLPWYRSPFIQLLGGACILFTVLLAAYSRFKASVARKNQLEAERHARESAEQLVAEREHLLRRVSHDLRNPVFVIGGCAEMVQCGELGQEEAFRILEETATSMEYLTNQLLSYSRAKTATKESEVETVPVFQALNSVCTKTQLVFRDSSNRISVEVSPDAPRLLNLPINATVEILQNLTSNAIKNTANGSVTLRYCIQQGKPTIEVADTGCGMSDEAVSKAFEPFYRQQDVTAVDSVSGFGLGLSICKLLAEEIGANLRITSEVGLGTTVSLQFPASTIANGATVSIDAQSQRNVGFADADVTTKAPRPHLAFTDTSCLVVDDVAFVRQTTVHRLAGAGIVATDCAPNNLPDLSKSSIRVILTDLEMPAVSGFKLAKTLRTSHKDLAIIAYSERVDLIDAARHSGLFDAVFTKADVLANKPNAIETLIDFCAPTRPRTVR